ncbi:MAG: hypothetical protein ABSG85_12580 [Spirochaetia bacterium]
MTKRAMFLMLALSAIGVPLLTAQSNEVLDAVLGEATLSYGNAAYLVGTASGRFPETITPAEAAPRLEQEGLGRPGLGPTDPVTLGDFSYMLTRAFGIHGGIMYWVLPSPRYATRELAYLGIISGPAKPGMPLSGERALRILEQMLHRKEAAR